MIRAHDLVELVEPEVEDVVDLAHDVGLHEALGLAEQGLLVHEVAADHAVLGVLPVPGEGADAVDHPLGLVGLPLPVRQDPEALQQFLFLLAGLLSSVLEAPLAGAGFMVLDVAEDRGHECGGSLAPARPRDVDLAGAAHAVLVEEGSEGVPSLWAARNRGELVEEAVVVAPRDSTWACSTCCRNVTTSGCGRITSATSSSASPISDVTLCGTDCVSVSATFFSPSHSWRRLLSHQVASIPAMIT